MHVQRKSVLLFLLIASVLYQSKTYAFGLTKGGVGKSVASMKRQV